MISVGWACRPARVIVPPGENFDVAIFSDTIKVISVKLCMVVLLVELFLFTPLLMT